MAAASIRLRLIALGLFWPLAAWADVAVIVHRDSPLTSMTAREVSDLYLGRARNVAAGNPHAPLVLAVYDQPANSPLRELFFQRLNGMAIKQVNAYWARLRFSGEVLSPPVAPDSRAVLEIVQRQANAIGYVESELVDGSVRVILRLKE